MEWRHFNCKCHISALIRRSKLLIFQKGLSKRACQLMWKALKKMQSQGLLESQLSLCLLFSFRVGVSLMESYPIICDRPIVFFLYAVVGLSLKLQVNHYLVIINRSLCFGFNTK